MSGGAGTDPQDARRRGALAAAASWIAPVTPEVRVSALGTDVVVAGCLAAGAEITWARLAGPLPGSPLERQ